MKLTVMLGLFVLLGSATIRATSFQSGIYTPINVPGAEGTTAVNGLNNLGEYVGTFANSTVQHGFLDNHGVFTTIDFPGSPRTVPIGINDAGQIVGYYDATTTFGGSPITYTAAFLYTKGVFITLPEPPRAIPPGLPGVEQTGIAINNAGQVVATIPSPCGLGCRPEGFLYSSGTVTLIWVSSSGSDTATYATGITNTGGIIGWYQTFLRRDHDVLKQGALGTDDVPGAFMTRPSGVNDAGHVVGTFEASPSGGGGGFLENDGIFTELDFQPTGINDLGQIAGGQNFIFTPTPEPASLLLFGSGLVAIGIAIGRKQRRLRR